MTAEEMLKRLGYIVIEDTCTIDDACDKVIYRNKITKELIIFDKYNKCVNDITMEGLKAINKQIEELGWV